VVVERHRASVGDHHVAGGPHVLDPGAELLRVGHRGREARQLHGRGQLDDDLLPDRPALRIGEVVHLVEDDGLQPRERRRVLVEHVAQDLGGHHHDRRVAADGVVTGEQAHPLRPVELRQVVELLVGQRLDGCRVEALAAVLQRLPDGELADDRLAGARRRRHERRAALGERADAAQLEVVERKRVSPDEPLGRPVRDRSRLRGHASCATAVAALRRRWRRSLNLAKRIEPS
jgi:hypothetical protein